MEPEAVKDAIDKLEVTFEGARKDINDKIKETGDETRGECKDLIAKATADAEAKHAELEETQKKLNAALNRKNFENPEDTKTAILMKEAAKTVGWMRDNAGTPGAAVELSKCVGEEILAETKDLSVADDTQAGFAVRTQLEQLIDATVTEISVFAQFANLVRLNRAERFERPVNQKGGVGASRDGEDERTAREDTGNPTVTMGEIAANWLRASVNVTGQLLDDSSLIDIVNWITTEAAEDMATRRDDEFFLGRVGTGRNAKEARGILTYDAGTTYGKIEQVGSGSAGAFTTDGLLKLVGSMKEAYQRNARFFARRQTIFTNLFTLKDAEDRYYLVPNWREGVQFQLLGFPIHMAPSMPAAASGSLSLAFGNFQRGYTNVERAGMTLLRDQYTAYPITKFRFGQRNGGDVENFEAIKLQVLT